MNEITFPLRVRMKRDTVADLHAALIKLGHEVSRAERKDHRFGKSTREAVRAFQSKHDLQASGEVDQATANKLNELIREAPMSEPKIYRVSGRVVRANGSPAKDAEIKFFRQGITKTHPLGRRNSTNTDATGDFAFEYSPPGVRPLVRTIRINGLSNLIGCIPCTTIGFNNGGS